MCKILTFIIFLLILSLSIPTTDTEGHYIFIILHSRNLRLKGPKSFKANLSKVTRSFKANLSKITQLVEDGRAGVCTEPVSLQTPCLSPLDVHSRCTKGLAHYVTATLDPHATFLSTPKQNKTNTYTLSFSFPFSSICLCLPEISLKMILQRNGTP